MGINNVKFFQEQYPEFGIVNEDSAKKVLERITNCPVCAMLFHMWRQGRIRWDA